MAEFNWAAMDLNAGREWLRRVVITEPTLSPYQRDLLEGVARDPKLIGTAEIWTTFETMPVREFLPLLLGKTSATLLKDYERIALAARRFSMSGDEFIEFTPPRTDLSWERPISSEPQKLVEEAMVRLAEKAGSLKVVKTGPDFVSEIRDAMIEFTEGSGSSQRVGYFNERLGILLIAGGGGIMKMWEETMRGALDDAFGGFRISATPVYLNYSAQDDLLKVGLPGRDPAVAHFESNATQVVAEKVVPTLDASVTVHLKGEKRPDGEPLIFEHGSGTARPGWPVKDETLYRIEAKVNFDFPAVELASVMTMAATDLKKGDDDSFFLMGARTLYDLAELDKAGFASLEAELVNGRTVDLLATGANGKARAEQMWMALSGHLGSSAGSTTPPKGANGSEGGMTGSEGGASGASEDGDVASSKEFAGVLRGEAGVGSTSAESDFVPGVTIVASPVMGAGTMAFAGAALSAAVFAPVG